MIAHRKSKEPGQAEVDQRNPEQAAHWRLQQLYEISKLLTRFDSAETTVPAVIAILGGRLPLRSAIFILEREGRPWTIVWQFEADRAHQLQAAKEHAQNSYAYLAGSARLTFLNDQDAANDARAGETAEPVDRKNFIMLPFAIEHQPIFGALQLESAGRMDEMDLVFVNAVVNQLAIALDRQATIEAKQSAAEAKQVVAEGRQIVAQAARDSAERMQAAARVEQAEAERKRDIARAEREAEERRRGAAEALRERYEALVDNIDHAFVWEADARTSRVSYLSARAEMLLGHPRERWLGNADFWTTCVHPDDHELVAHTFRQALTEKKDQRCNHRCLTVEGHVVWFHTGIHLAHADTRAPQFQGVSVDITPAKDAANRILAQLDFTQTVTGSLGEGVIAVNWNGRVTLINSAAAHMLGCNEGEALGRQLEEILQIGSADGTAILDGAGPFDRAMKSGESFRTEEQLFSAPGRPGFPVSYTCAPLRRGKQISGAVLAFQDISERKQAERELREAADRFRFMAESMPQKIFTAKPSGNVDYVNQQWLEFTGLPFERLEDWGWTQLIHPDDLEENVSRWRTAVETGHPLELEHRVRQANGRYRWHLTRARSMSGADSTVTMWIGSSTDIDDQKRAEEEQRLLAEVGTIVTSFLDRRATFAAVARCAVPLFADLCLIDEVSEDGGVQRREVVFADPSKQRDLADRVRKFSPRPNWKTPQALVIASGEPRLFAEIVDHEKEGIAQNAEHASAMRAAGAKSMIVVPLHARGKRLGALTFVAGQSGRRYSSHDLAIAEEFARRVATGIDNAWLYEKAQRATRAREELLAIVSHDLKNPLNVILMSASMMRPANGVEDRRSSRGQLETIRRSAKRMNRLIQELLDTASIEAGKLVIERRRLSVFPIVHDAIEAMQPLAARQSLSLTSDLAADIPGVFVDPSRVQQIFANLLGNAIKFTPPGGTITVRAEIVGGEVLFSVADTGSGIPEQDLPRLFERFWQAARTAGQGTGLGLSIVKGIVVAHGGRVWAESRVGDGTTFFFTLPLASNDGDDVTEAETADQLIGVEILRAEALRAEVEKYATELDELGEEGRKRELRTALESTRVARELAEGATQFRRDFMDLAANELREPLTGIELVMEHMQREGNTPPASDQEHALSGILASVARLTAVIESLLKHALVEGGRLTTQMSTFDVHQITREVIAELRPYAEKKGIELRFTSHFEDLIILSDPELTRLILLNLVSNAIKFMEKGVVEISTDRTPEGCCFAVSDSGPGIPAEERVSIFDPFAKRSGMTQQSDAALGLGLSLVREVASALGGQVELESEIDRGSTFTVTLPSLPEALRDPHATLS